MYCTQELSREDMMQLHLLLLIILLVIYYIQTSSERVLQSPFYFILYIIFIIQIYIYYQFFGVLGFWGRHRH